MVFSPPLDLCGQYYPDHPVFVPPENPDATIWRYIDFTKFVSLLDNKRLFFAPVALLDDPFEGSYPTPNLAARKEFWAENPPAPPDEFYAEAANNIRKSIFVNSWNLSEVESAAFWRLYVPPSGGVAIRSTFRRLTDSFCISTDSDSARNLGQIHIGQVQYIDYDQTVLPEHNAFYPYVHKRRSFAFESELRAVMSKFPLVEFQDGERTPFDLERAEPTGLRVSVDLDQLIGSIHVSPYAPPWFANLVSSVAEHYGCAASVKQSSLSAQPVF